MEFILNYVPLNDKPFMITHDEGEERLFFTRDELTQFQPVMDALCKQAVVTMEPVRFTLLDGERRVEGPQVR